MPELRFAEPSERDDLGAFAARAVRLDSGCAVRLRRRDGEHVEAWVSTPFDVLAVRAVGCTVDPADVTVSGNELLAALTVARGDRVDPGPARDLEWRSPLPGVEPWRPVDAIPVVRVAELADSGLVLAREHAGPRGTPPASLLDQGVLEVDGDGMRVTIPLRCLFALSGMGFFGAGGGDDVVRVSATDSWLRIDARYGAVVRRRHALLPLLF